QGRTAAAAEHVLVLTGPGQLTVPNEAVEDSGGDVVGLDDLGLGRPVLDHRDVKRLGVGHSSPVGGVVDPVVHVPAVPAGIAPAPTFRVGPDPARHPSGRPAAGSATPPDPASKRTRPRVGRTGSGSRSTPAAGPTRFPVASPTVPSSCRGPG